MIEFTFNCFYYHSFVHASIYLMNIKVTSIASVHSLLELFTDDIITKVS